MTQLGLILLTAILVWIHAVFCSDSPEPGPKSGLRPDDPILGPYYPEVVTGTVTIVAAKNSGGSDEGGESEGDDSESEVEHESESGPRTVVRTVAPPQQVDVIIGSPVLEARAVIPPPEPDAILPPQVAPLQPLVIIGEQLQQYPGQLLVQQAPRIFPYHRKPGRLVNNPEGPIYEKPYAQKNPKVIKTIHIMEGSAPVPNILPAPRYQRITDAKAERQNAGLFPLYPKKVLYADPGYRVANSHSELPLGQLIPSPPGYLEQPILAPRYQIATPVEKPEAPRYYPSQQPLIIPPLEHSSPHPETTVVSHTPAPSVVYQTNVHYNLPPPHYPYDPSLSAAALPPPPPPPAAANVNIVLATDTPLCARDTGLLYCLSDPEYPTAEINAYIAMYPEQYQLLKPMVPWKIISGRNHPSAPYLHFAGHGGSSPPYQPAILDHIPATTQQIIPDTCRSHTLPSAKVLRAINGQDKWKVIVHLPEAVQTCYLETCDTNRSCRFGDQFVQTQCYQEYSHQQLMVYSPEFGVHVDVMKIPRGCQCRIANHKPPQLTRYPDRIYQNYHAPPSFR